MAAKQKSLRMNFIMNMILTMSTFIFPFITFPYVSRILLPEGTGKVSLATSVISYFSMFAQMGIPTYGIRACAKVRDQKEELTRTAHELLFINLCLDVVAYAALFLAIWQIPRLREEKTLYLIISSTIFLTSVGMEWLYRALEQYTYITVRSVIFKFIALVMMFLLVHEQKDYVLYGGISIFAASASNLLNLVNAHKYIGFKPVGNYHLKRHYKPIAIFFSMACASTIYTHLDTVMLGFMKDDAEVGLYNAAVKIKIILVSIVTSLGTVLLPRASYYVQNRQMDDFWKICKKAVNFVFVLSIPMLTFFTIFASEGILFLSGPAYTGSVASMQIIMPTLLFIGLTNILGIQILVPLGQEKMVLVSEICGAVVDLIINAVLIPPYGAAGAAAGTLVAEIAVFVVQAFCLKKECGTLFRGIRYHVILIGTAAGVGGSFWVHYMDFHPFVSLAAAAVSFFILYFVILLLLKEELTTSIFAELYAKLKKLRGAR